VIWYICGRSRYRLQSQSPVTLIKKQKKKRVCFTALDTDAQPAFAEFIVAYLKQVLGGGNSPKYIFGGKLMERPRLCVLVNLLAQEYNVEP